MIAKMHNDAPQDNGSDQNTTTTWLPWQEKDWLKRVTVSIEKHLVGNDRRRIGDVEILHQRPWSAFARIPTELGIVYFNAPVPGLVSEARLTQALRRWRPDCIVPLPAIDPVQGWMLSPDSGVTH